MRDARRIADLGSGAGWPGFALAAALPEARVALVDSASRHCRYLARAAEDAGVTNVDVVHARAEGWPAGIGAHDLVTARALAALPVLCEYAAPLLADGGSLVAWKGAVTPEEAADGAAAAARARPRAGRGAARDAVPGRARAHAARVPQDVAHAASASPAGPESRRNARSPREDERRSAPIAFRSGGSGPNPPRTAASVGGQMSVYAIANQKGGVGKTTTAVNVAACIAAAGYETLVVDVDPQGNATVGLGVTREDGPGLYEVLRDEVSAEEALRPTDIANLTILASTPDLAGGGDGAPARRGLGEPPARGRWRRSATASRSSCSTARRRSGRSRSTPWSPPTA